ncbi:hypothetical protein Mame01_58010 [Microbispora amethystogenes]|nr:hypothetical protein Mame01_58010 [Microbispora amethystogenes]
MIGIDVPLPRGPVSLSAPAEPGPDDCRPLAGPPRLILFARSGFSAELVRLAGRRPDVELVHLGRLYGGD